MEATLLMACEALIGGRVLQHKPVSGGSINLCWELQTDQGSFFLKYLENYAALKMFETEAQGLSALAQCKELHIPRVLGFGEVGGISYLLMGFLKRGFPGTKFWESFGRALAALHRITNAQFGLDHDNFIGRLPQSNRYHSSWISFYINERIIPQLELAYQRDLFDTKDRKRFDDLFKVLPILLFEEPPALIHGDLWSGNFLCLPDGKVALFDPAVCYANREMDLAMSLLFGGFAPSFYEAYAEAYPLEGDWKERVDLYQLYYLLAHVNLFGVSYVSSVRRILDQYLGKKRRV